MTPVSDRPNSGADMDNICIVENPDVVVSDFVPVLEKRLNHHGIATRVVKERKEDCRYFLEYSAKQSWDMVRYLSWAELKIYERQNLVGSAEYKLRGKGGRDKNESGC
ncbi:hypothetical protein [Neisseria sp.]|uniref:hypothetical protein n=1 Tax=Neisseria sp. TaxID=192066 RepID=UPI0034C6556F